LITSGAGEDSEQEYKKYISTLEQEHIRSRRRFRARVQEIHKYIGAGAHPEQEKIQSESTRIQKYIETGAQARMTQSKSKNCTRCNKYRSTLAQEHM
jgi:hypothetical protein